MVDNKYKYWAGGGALAGTFLGISINLGYLGATSVFATFAGYAGGGTYVGATGSLASLMAGSSSLTALGVIAVYVLPALIFAAIVYIFLFYCVI